MEEKCFKFSKEDENKEYGIEYYFEEVLKTGRRTKSLGVINSDNYKFYMFNGDHMAYTSKYSDDEHLDKVMFNCDNEAGSLALIFNCRSQSEIGDVFIGRTMIKILEEYRKFLQKHHDEIKDKSVKFVLSNNFYKENIVVPYDNKNLDKIDKLIGEINMAIISLHEEVASVEEELKEREKNRKQEINPMYKILKKFIKA